MVLYSATGNAWMNPQAITISFMPDGTNLGGPVSNLQSTFNNNPYLNGNWQTQILKAAQVWAQQSNINLIVVPDNGTPLGGGADQEGDPGMGDIRIGGYNFGNSALAEAYQPPPINNFSVAGDIIFNTAQTWNIGRTYDLFTVASHEFGHALGLGHSSAGSPSIMYPTYTGVKAGLSSDDIAGIRSIYSGGTPRSQDPFGGANNSFSTAASLTNLLDPLTYSVMEPNLDIATAGQSEYFSVVAPLTVGGSMHVTVQSQGLSLLAPKVTVYTPGLLGLLGSPTVVGSANGAGRYGTTLTVNIPSVLVGQTYYIHVQGADNTAFGTGDYSLGVSYGGLVPTVVSPIIAYLDGANPSSGGGSPDQVNPNGVDTLAAAPPTITGISPDTGASTNDGVTNASRIVISGVAPSNDTITVYNNGAAIGTAVANANGTWSFDNTATALSDGTYSFTATATDPSGNMTPPSYPYLVTIDTTPPAPPSLSGFTAGIQQGSNWTINIGTTPILYGTAAPFSVISLYNGSTPVGTTTTDRNGDWNFPLSTGGLSTGKYSFSATATDLAGNVSSLASPYSVHLVSSSTSTAAASVSNVSLSAGSILGTASGIFGTIATPTINGTATANSEVVAFEDGVVIGVAMVDASGGWTYTCPTLTTGVHALTFEDVSMVGSYSASTGPLNIQV